MQFYPPSQQPNYQQQPQFLPPSFPQQMTPLVPPKPEIPTIQAQRFPPPFQPPIIPQFIPQVATVAPQVPNPQGASQYQNAQQIKMPPPQPQRPSPISTNLNTTNKDRYVWAQKKDKMPWGIAESLDPGEFVRRGDLRSVLFYMNQFMNATITKEDLKKFGSKGALNAFLILQLGTEYLLNEYNRLEHEIEEEMPANEQTNIDLVNKYNEKIDVFNAELRKREDLIAKYKKQNEELKNRVKQMKDALSAKEKKRNKHNSTTITPAHLHEDQKSMDKTSETYESGLLHVDTDIQKLKKVDQDSNIIFNHKSSKSKEETGISLSDGEIPKIMSESGAIDSAEVIEYEEEEEEGDEY